MVAIRGDTDRARPQPGRFLRQGVAFLLIALCFIAAREMRLDCRAQCLPAEGGGCLPAEGGGVLPAAGRQCEIMMGDVRVRLPPAIIQVMHYRASALRQL